MNIYDKNSKRIGVIIFSKKYLILNEGSANILYEFNNYEKLISDLKNKVTNQFMDYLLENITANVPEIEQLIKNKSIQKKKDFESDSQLSLF